MGAFIRATLHQKKHSGLFVYVFDLLSLVSQVNGEISHHIGDLW